MIGRIYVELNMTLLHIKYTSFVSCGCREEDFFMYFHYKSMVDNDMPGAWPVWTPGFIKRSTIHCSIENMKALGLVVSEKKIFFCFSHCKSMGANDPQGGAIFDPRGMVGRIYKEYHYTLLHTKYECSGPCGFGEEGFFYVFPIVNLWELLTPTPGFGPFWTPGA